MTFGEFCKYFYKPINGLKGKKSKSAIVKFFLDLALGYETDYDLSYYNKWFNDSEMVYRIMFRILYLMVYLF